METNVSVPLRIIVSGTAGTGKSYLINCLRVLLREKVCVAAPTGIAAFNIDGNTLHSLLSLPTKGEFKDLEGEHLNRLQQALSSIQYLIIDEISMVGRKLFGQVDRRLRQVFPTFDHAVILDQIMRQSGDDSSQSMFRDILLRLRNCEVTKEDWRILMTRTPAQVSDVSNFSSGVHLFPTIEAVAEHNVQKLHGCGQPVATIKAVHTGPNSSKASTDDAGGLQPVVCLAKGACVMLSSNLWVEMGLVNGAMGTVQAIFYDSGGPPDLPVAVTVLFDRYSGPTLPDGTVPIAPLHHTWLTSGNQCSRLQLPLNLAWAVTIHKAQGLTLNKLIRIVLKYL